MCKYGMLACACMSQPANCTNFSFNSHITLLARKAEHLSSVTLIPLTH
jgi:hypothetical protein